MIGGNTVETMAAIWGKCSSVPERLTWGLILSNAGSGWTKLCGPCFHKGRFKNKGGQWHGWVCGCSSFAEISRYGYYLGKFSEPSAPLRQLAHKDSEWVWQEQQQHEALKSHTSSPPVLSYYDVSEASDALQNELGAACLQEGEPVAYASRTLTDMETRYAQIEKELVGGVFFALTSMTMVHLWKTSDCRNISPALGLHNKKAHICKTSETVYHRLTFRSCRAITKLLCRHSVLSLDMDGSSKQRSLPHAICPYFPLRGWAEYWRRCGHVRSRSFRAPYGKVTSASCTEGILV